MLPICLSLLFVIFLHKYGIVFQISIYKINIKKFKLCIKSKQFNYMDINLPNFKGGRNGYGAKLCNIFSEYFTLETSSKEFKKKFKQVSSRKLVINNSLKEQF